MPTSYTNLNYLINKCIYVCQKGKKYTNQETFKTGEI